ncbi:MAG TPA: EamA family transporter [Alphaproteobacteria bacterium]|nr:EamA family transporter [Alphaproteobacteria bacterium]
METLLILILIIACTIAGALTSLFMKKASKEFNLNIFKQIKNKYLYGAAIMYIIGTVTYIYALTLDNLSLIYPLTSLTYIWVYLLSHNILKEKISLRKWIGMSLIIVGIILIIALKP